MQTQVCSFFISSRIASNICYLYFIEISTHRFKINACESFASLFRKASYYSFMCWFVFVNVEIYAIDGATNMWNQIMSYTNLIGYSCISVVTLLLRIHTKCKEQCMHFSGLAIVNMSMHQNVNVFNILFSFSFLKHEIRNLSEHQ